MKKGLNICVFTFPFASLAGIPTLSNLIKVLSSFSDNLYFITGKTGYDAFRKEKGISILQIDHQKGGDPFTRVIKYCLTQLRLSFKLFQLRRDVDYYVYFVNSVTLAPLVIIKMLRKEFILILPASHSEISKAQKDALWRFIWLIEKMLYLVSDRIIVYSKGLISSYKLEKYTSKISIAHQHFIDINKFNVTKRLSERSNLVGYIGRLSEEKGVLNFIISIPFILEKTHTVRFIIGGDGELRRKILDYIKTHGLENVVQFTGWISHEHLPSYLNELKLLVLPSSTEGLPSVMLEAMSCGTPVLATTVGGIPDVIRDGESGFLMKKNSPDCIAENIIRALNNANLEVIAERARDIIEKKFTYHVASKQYQVAINSNSYR